MTNRNTGTPGAGPAKGLERRILDTIRRRGLVSPGQRGLVAVSGGVDSLALLHLLHALRETLDMRLEVVHFDHGLREESGREADWVAERAGGLGLPCHIVRAGHLAGLGAGVQAAARAWRREEAGRLLVQWEAHWVATGHQRDDQLETWLLKWLRGAHLSHLQGMDWRGGPFIRPLLDTPRAALRAYLEDKGETWLEDPSNASPVYRRNRVRNELLPLLDDLAGGRLERRIGALSRQSRRLRRWLEDWLEDWLAHHAAGPGWPAPMDGEHWLDIAGLTALAETRPLQAEALLHRFIVSGLPGEVPYEALAQALALLGAGENRWQIHLPGARRLRREGGRLYLEPNAPEPPAPRREGGGEERDLARQDAGNVHILHPAGWRVTAGESAPDDPPAPEHAAITLHGIPPGTELVLRTRRPGDRFHPPWKTHPVKLKDFLRDRHIPLWQRERLPLVVWGERIIAVLVPGARGLAAPPHHQPDGAGAPLHLTVRA